MSQEDAWNETTIKLSKATEVIFNYFNLTIDMSTNARMHS